MFIDENGASKPGYWHLFTLNTVPKVLKYFGLNYIFCLVIFYSAFFYVLFKCYKSRNIKDLIKDQDFFDQLRKLLSLNKISFFIKKELLISF